MEGNIYYGESAELSQCRVAASIEGDPTVLLSVLRQRVHRERNDEKSSILWGPSTVETDFHEDSTSHEGGTNVLGQLVITSEQLLFWTNSSSSSINCYDLRADATCIDLHAMTNNSSEMDKADDDTSICGVYVQFSDGDVCDENGYDVFREVTFCPVPFSTPRNCQTLFDAISKLVTLHPIDANDLPDRESVTIPGSLGDHGNMWFGTEPFMTADGMHSYENCKDSDGNDDLVVAFNDDVGGVTSIDGETERILMLERLDRLLVVPPEFEYSDDESAKELEANGNSQFDDADSDNE